MNTLILEETEQGEDMAIDVYQRLANDRILFIHEFIDDKLASNICATLLLKNAESKEEKISLFINSEGGDIRSVFMIYDMMNIIDAPIETICAGSAWDESLLILAAGTEGMRFATQNSVICASHLMYDKMHFSDLTDARIIKDLIKNDNKRMLEAFASITKKTYKQIADDFSNKTFMTPAQAKKYGLIDGIVKNKK
jgi:ATP-dependent Clp protease protease subunit